MITTTIYLSFIGVLNTFMIIIGILLLPLYFLPSIIAAKKHNRIAILVLNLLAGWTIIGWIIALIWSIVETPLALTVITDDIENSSPKGKIKQAVETLKESKDLLDLGIVSQEKYDKIREELTPIIKGI